MDGVNNTARTFSPDNGGATGSGNAPSRGSLGGRRVSTAPGQESPARSPVKRRRQLPGAGASAEARGTVPLSKRAPPAPRSVPAPQAALPGPARSSAEPPGRATATADTVSVPQNPGTAAGREPLPRPVVLPWLDKFRNAALAISRLELQEVLERQDLPDKVKQHLSRGFEIMTRAERDIVRVDAVLRRTALENFTLAERTELERLVLSIREDLARGTSIPCIGPWYCTVPEAIDDLLERNRNAREYFYSANVPWEPAIRRLAIMKAAQAEAPVTVERRPVPLELPGSQPRPGDCPDLEHAARIVGAPDCMHTAMTDANGRVLYRGISHSLIQPRPTEEEAARYSEAAVRRGAEGIVKAVAAQALQSDPEKFARACNGEIVDIELLAIPTLHDSDTFDFIPQWLAFEALEATPLVQSRLDHKGHAHIIRANVRFQHIFVKIGEVSARMAFCVSQFKLVEWLGPLGDRELSGELSETIDDMKDRVSELRVSMIRELPSIRPANKPFPEVGPAPNKLRKLGENSAYLERNLRMLEQAGMDCKGYLRGRFGTCTDEESAIDCAARIALVAHLSCQTPVLCYLADSDTVMRVESRIESLLRFAGAHEGNIPMPPARPAHQ